MVAIVAEMVADAPGRYQLTGVRLRYKLNGAERVGEGIDTIFTLCADSSEPEDCPRNRPSDKTRPRSVAQRMLHESAGRPWRAGHLSSSVAHSTVR
jgi:hypothetical protein